jgi:hypothetical protein
MNPLRLRLRLHQYIQDAERDGDDELADLFRRARGQSQGRRTGQNAARVPHRQLTSTATAAASATQVPAPGGYAGNVKELSAPGVHATDLGWGALFGIGT